jgi:predicted acylesterase/phospholipase RssA/CRP-like cAMP-binding protein
MTPKPPQHWLTALRETELFADLDPEAIVHLGTAVREIEIAAGESLIRQGDDASSLFVILDGTCDVLLEKEGVTLHQIGPRAVVGEVALVVGGKRSATIRALGPVKALELSRDDFEGLLSRHPELMSPFRAALQERLRRVKIAGHLQTLFGQLDPAALAEIERQLTWIQLASGRELFRQGDPANGAYIVVVGRLRVVLGDRTIDEVGPGQWIGEMALLTRSERSATVYAIRDTELVWLSQAAFDDLITRYPKAMLATSRLLVARLQRQMGMAGSGRRPEETTRSLAIVPANPGVVIDELAIELAKALGGYGTALRMTSSSVDEALGKPGIAQVGNEDPAHLRLTPWLIQQEETHRFVIYQADARWSGWTDRVTRHADHILIVGDGTGIPALGEVEAKLASRFASGRAPKQSLVLLQPNDRVRFSGTAHWLQARSVHAHYHVRRRVSADVSRLARMLTGNAIGLVCGGGGSRGYAHIGVLRALEELNVPVDVVGGTSAGAIFLGAKAFGMSSSEILATTAPILGRLFDPTLPIVSLVSGHRMTEGIFAVAQGAEIEDCLTPFFAVSTNLTRGQQVIHRTGSIAFAIRASSSVPGVFPPVPHNGDLLVDGGLSNNVPVDVMAQLYGGAIIAVDVIPKVDLQVAGDVPPSISGWQVAWRKINPLTKKVDLPNIVSVLMRSVTTAGRLHAGETAEAASLYLRPQVSRWNMLDFKAASPIAEEGYRNSREPIRQWWAAERSALTGWT